MLNKPETSKDIITEPYSGLKGFGLASVEKLECQSAFVGKRWNRQDSTRFVFKVERVGKPIEASIYEHSDDSTPQDVAFEVSEAYGCPVKCTYCASGSLPGPISPLSSSEIAGQYFLLQRYFQAKGGDNTIRRTVNYQGIGEPTLLAKQIIEASNLIVNQDPAVTFKMSTMGFAPERIAHDFAESNVPWSSIQVTLPHWETSALRSLYKGAPECFDPNAVLKAVKIFSNQRPGTKIKFNYICIDGFNNSTDILGNTVNLIKSHGFTFSPRVEMKLSYLNPTFTAKLNALQSLDETHINGLLHYLQDTLGVEHSYAFGPMQDINVACGQLASRDFGC